VSRTKRYCLYRAILFLLLLSLILVFREKEKSLYPLIIFAGVFICDELLFFFLQQKPKLHNFLLDVTYLSILIIFTGGVLSPFIPFYLPIIALSAYMLLPVDSFAVSGFSMLYYGILSIFLTERIPENFILISLPEFPPFEMVLLEFIVYSFAFIFTAAASSLVIQMFKEQLTRVRVNISDIVEAIDYGIITVDEKGNVVWSNSRAANFMGVSLLSGKNLLEISVSPFKESIEKILNRKEKQLEFEIGDKVFMLRGTDLFEGKGTILMINDKTEEKDIERKIQMRDKLVTLGNFAANLAHEVRNPVSSIRASAELIGPSKGKANKNKKLKEVIMKESDRLDYLVESFLDFTKSFNLENQEIRLHGLIKDVIHDLKKNKYYGKDIEFKNQIKEDFTMKGDYNLLKSVFFNLGVNSLKAMTAGGSLVFGTKENGKTFIFVKDTGCGIDKQDLNKIFSPFYSRFKEGFGFGLPIVKKIVELHNWDIEVESIVKEGTEIRIVL
jgi:signal transduction histidine kinase